MTRNLISSRLINPLILSQELNQLMAKWQVAHVKIQLKNYFYG